MKTRQLAVGLLASLALTACGDGQARGGTAASVGDGAATVSTSELAEYVARAEADPAATTVAADLPQYQRDLLSALINGDLLEVVAERLGVSVGQTQVDEQYQALVAQNGGEEQLLQAAAREGLDRELLLRIQRSRALSSVIGLKLTEDIAVDPVQLQATFESARDAFDRITISTILLPTEGAASALLPRARALDDAGFQELARERTTDPDGAQTGGLLGPLTQTQFAELGEPALGLAVFATPRGNTVAVPAASGGRAYLVRVLDRDTQTLAEATPRLRQAILQEQISQAVTAELATVDVDVNARFGRWDPQRSAVVVEDGERPLSRQVSNLDTTVAPSLGSTEGASQGS